MKNFSQICLVASVCLLTGFSVNAFDEPAKERPREGQRDGDRPQDRGARDGDERGERGPRDGDRPGERGPRDGGRPPMMGGPVLSALDTNHNGILESDEIDQAIAVLRRMDRNRDGRLTGEEFGRRREGGRPPLDGDRPSPEQMMARFKEADKNDDGKLSKEEAPERMKEGFNRIDANEDGFVDKGEFEALIRRIRGGQGRPPREGEERGPRKGGERGEREREGDGERRRPEAE